MKRLTTRIGDLEAKTRTRKGDGRRGLVIYTSEADKRRQLAEFDDNDVVLLIPNNGRECPEGEKLT
jgi:hypothetical protein